MNKELKFLNIISNSLDNNQYLGDDCAILKDYNLAISSDSLIEDVHFSLKYMTISEIAQKSMLVNISDILASGAKPKYMTINLSGKLNEEIIKEFYDEVNKIANEYDISIIGGDLTKSEKLTISITIFGDCKNRNISSRKNAKENYIVATVGEFGSSAQGLEDLIQNKKNYFTSYHKKPILYPEISNEIALKTKYSYAMMDSSDGLIDCLIQISNKSKVEIDIEYDKINKKTKNKDFVLHGGEDFALVICLDERDFNNIKGLTKIGTCSNGSKVFIDKKEINYKGFNHFE